MKKLAIVILALALSANLVACGGSKPAPSSSAPAPAPAPSSSAPAPAPSSSEPASEEVADDEFVFELNYDQIATWVDGGFIGTDDTDSPVVMALDEANEFAIIIFGDNSDMSAASFVGEITYEGDFGTITDAANEMSLTFGIAQIAEDTIELDMGEEIGKATIKSASKEEVLKTIKLAIENYEHVA